MEIMQFILGLYVGVVLGYVLRDLLHKADYKIGYGSNGKTKSRHQ